MRHLKSYAWRRTIRLESGRFLAVAIKVIKGQYQKFAGVGRTEAEAMTKAVRTMWIVENKARRGLEDSQVVALPSPIMTR